MLDITELLNAIIALIAALVSAFLIPWLKNKTTAQRQEQMSFWVARAVQAAEEYYRGPGQGEQKLVYVRDFLAERGIKLDEQEALVLIRGAVWELIHQFEEEKEPVIPESAE